MVEILLDDPGLGGDITACNGWLADGVETVDCAATGDPWLPGVFDKAFATEAGVLVDEVIAAKKLAGNGTGDSFGGIYTKSQSMHVGDNQKSGLQTL